MLRLVGWQTPKVLQQAPETDPGARATLDTPVRWCVSQKLQILVAAECEAGYSLEQQPQHTNNGCKERLRWAGGGGVSTASPRTHPLNSIHCTTEVMMYNIWLIHESIFWRASHPKRVPWTTHLDKLRYHYGATTALVKGASTPLHARTSSRGRGVITATRLNDGSSSVHGGHMDSSLGSSNSGGNGKLLVTAVAVVAAAAAAWWWWWLSS